MFLNPIVSSEAMIGVTKYQKFSLKSSGAFQLREEKAIAPLAVGPLRRLLAIRSFSRSGYHVSGQPGDSSSP